MSTTARVDFVLSNALNGHYWRGTYTHTHTQRLYWSNMIAIALEINIFLSNKITRSTTHHPIKHNQMQAIPATEKKILHPKNIIKVIKIMWLVGQESRKKKKYATNKCLSLSNYIHGVHTSARASHHPKIDIENLFCIIFIFGRLWSSVYGISFHICWRSGKMILLFYQCNRFPLHVYSIHTHTYSFVHRINNNVYTSDFI